MRESILESLKATMKRKYKGSGDISKLLDKIVAKHCIKAEHDHIKDRRIYMHIGCKENTICYSSSIDLVSKQNAAGLLSHEIGHIISMYYPSLMHGMDAVCLDSMTVGGVRIDLEILADLCIKETFGMHIYYDENKVQYLLTRGG